MAGTPVKGSTLPASGKVLVVEQCQRAIALQRFWGETIRARILVRTPFQGLGDRVENENSKVRELEKVRFGKKKVRPALYRKIPPLVREKGQQSDQQAAGPSQEEGGYTQKAYMCGDASFRGGLFFLKIILIS